MPGELGEVQFWIMFDIKFKNIDSFARRNISSVKEVVSRGVFIFTFTSSEFPLKLWSI